MGLLELPHFDQLISRDFYRIQNQQSSGIFKGILSIAVGSLFKIIAVSLCAAEGWVSDSYWYM